MRKKGEEKSRQKKNQTTHLRAVDGLRWRSRPTSRREARRLKVDPRGPSQHDRCLVLPNKVPNSRPTRGRQSPVSVSVSVSVTFSDLFWILFLFSFLANQLCRCRFFFGRE